jgi:hypothetical protein
MNRSNAPRVSGCVVDSQVGKTRVAWFRPTRAQQLVAGEPRDSSLLNKRGPP